MHRDDPEFTKMYPFESHYCELSSGVRMHYVDQRSGHDNEEILLMLHGNPTWSFYYRNLIKEFASKYRVIAPDHIGMGLSDKPQQYEYTLKNHIQNLKELLSSITCGTERINLIVHDWGGAIGMGWATGKKNIDRIGKITILNTGAFLSTEIPLRINICRIPGFGALAIRGFNAFAAGATYMAVEKPLSNSIKQGYLLPYDNWKNRIATLRFVQDIPLNNNAKSYKTLEKIDHNLQNLQNKEVLILWGGRDWCFNDNFFVEWRKRFPDAVFEYYENGGHYILEDKDSEIRARLRDFL